MLKVLKCVTNHKIGSAALAAIILTMLVLSTEFLDPLDGKHLISSDFRKAAQNIAPQAYFTSEISYGPGYYKAEGKEKKVMGARKAVPHYNRITELLCDPVKDIFRRMVGDGISAKDVFAFDEELNAVMREAGAYVLPLRAKKVIIDAVFYNPKWRNGEPDSYGNMEGGNGKFLDLYAEYARQMGGGIYPEPEDKGRLHIRIVSSNAGGNQLRFKPFYDFAVKENGFEIKEYKASFDFVREYVFILPQDPNDIQKETIFLYVSLPFSIESKRYGEISSLTNPDKDKKIKASCYGYSNSHAVIDRAHRLSSGSQFLEGKLFVSGLSEFLAPMILPWKGRYYRREENHIVNKANIAEPSLKCWMLGIGHIQGDIAECVNTGYAAEYMEMQNRNICIGFNRVEPFPTLSYPLSQEHRNNLTYIFSVGRLPSEKCKKVGKR